MFATMNLHNLFHFLRERLHPHAQYEIRVFAEAMLKLIEPIVPVAVKAFKAKMEKEK
jgi:thymidylate synthase (FAD)